MIDFTRERIKHWDRVSAEMDDSERAGAYYHSLLAHHYRLIVPEGMRVLELGCGHGNLLAAVKPSFGVGLDFSSEMLQIASRRHPGLHFIQADAHSVAFQKPFDIVILSDFVNDLWDVQQVLEQLRTYVHPRTRIVINFFNNLWRLPLSAVNRSGNGANLLEQNWLSPGDMKNLLGLAGFEMVKNTVGILLPVPLAGVSRFANRFLAPVAPFKWFALANFMVARPLNDNRFAPKQHPPSVSVVVPARNEAGNIKGLLDRIPDMGSRTEIIFVEGGSADDTYDRIEQAVQAQARENLSLYRQNGRGKGDAVRLGFEKASGDVLMILDADMTVPPESLPRFYEAIAGGQGEFINGVRLVYPLEDQAMQFMNILGNKFFSLAFSWLLGQPIKDTLCGTKVLWKEEYDAIARNRAYFGDFDPFGDFDLLFGAAKLNLKIVEMPIRYRERVYGTTNIRRWAHGWLLLKMAVFAAKRIKFV